MNRCTIDGCERAHYGRGWCKRHYDRWRHSGSPHGVERWADKVVRLAREAGETDRCLVRKGKLYRWTVQTPSGDNMPAYRWVCTVIHGAPPFPDADCAHSCRSGPQGCFNPNHLRWATRAENIADTLADGTRLRGAAANGAKLTVEQVREIRRRRAEGERGKDLAAEFGISKASVTMIVNRTNWGWLDGHVVDSSSSTTASSASE